MVVVNPADATETVKAIEAILDYDGPVYCRLGRFAVPVVFDPATYKFELGKGNVLADGKDVAIFATGIMNAAALEAREQLKAYGVDAAIIDIHTIKPIDKDLIAHYAAKTGAVVTAEEHNIIGGLGSAVTEAVCEGCPVPVLRVGTEDTFGRSGSVPDLLAFYNLNAAAIADKARRAVALKK
jgi:transketolase